MDQRKFLSQCQCDEPGFCPIFMRRMGTNPPDWSWCQKTCLEDRLSYYELLLKQPKTSNTLFIDFIKDLDTWTDKRFYLTYYLAMSDKYSKCDKAQISQIHKNKTIEKYLRQSKEINKDFSNVEILCLGHSDAQFDSIHDMPYLKKIDLNHVNAGNYSDNKWAEARAFLDPNLFSSNAEWIGFTTASWNFKYEAFSRIDNFHNWDSARVLINSKPDDNIVLCADIFCPCMWFHEDNNVLSVFFDKNARELGETFLNLVGLKFEKHVKSPVSNQMILHRTTYNKYYRYLIDNNIFDKIDSFVNSIASKYLKQRNDDDLIYAHSRVNGYLIEMLTSFWFASQDFLYFPNAERKADWYEQNSIKKRLTTFV